MVKNRYAVGDFIGFLKLDIVIFLGVVFCLQDFIEIAIEFSQDIINQVIVGFG